jgi:hypothetical protein
MTRRADRSANSDSLEADVVLQMDRRRFLALCAAAGGALAIPWLPSAAAPASALSAVALRAELSGWVRLDRRRPGKRGRAGVRGRMRKRGMV